MSASLAITAPSLSPSYSIISKIYVVFDPGAAHESKTNSPHFGSRNNGGNMETSSYLVSRPDSFALEII